MNKVKVIGVVKAVVITALLVICIGCQSFSCSGEVIKGNGTIETKTFPQNNFNAISISGGWTADIRYSETFSIQIETDENIFPDLDISVAGTTLNIGFKSGYSISPTQCKVSITMPALIKLQTVGSLTAVISSFNMPKDSMSIDISGSGNITARDITVNTLKVDVSGSADFSATGKAENMIADISGSGDIKTTDFETEKADISISGSGSAKVWVTRHLKADIGASGSVRYKGNPVIETKSSGSGRISSL
ncbi:head GIN domain-containing protein [Treponema denticola]|uniref:head GIN domain-containing protein n=1 Tax=Treponema denticola TaxID=158 RepID=UPI0011C938C6|nr:head GIN domain-containing protein [Treponema denticola]